MLKKGIDPELKDRWEYLKTLLTDKFSDREVLDAEGILYLINIHVNFALFGVLRILKFDNINE